MLSPRALESLAHPRRPRPHPPGGASRDVANRLEALAKRARRLQLGLWGECQGRPTTPITGLTRAAASSRRGRGRLTSLSPAAARRSPRPSHGSR